MEQKATAPEGKRPPWRTILLLALTITVVFFIYQIAVVTFESMAVFIAYFVLLGALALFYFIYNYCFSRHKVTREMLPLDWSEEEKDKFLFDAAERKRKSRFALYLIIALLVTLTYDFLGLFMEDALRPVQNLFDSWFGGLK